MQITQNAAVPSASIGASSLRPNTVPFIHIPHISGHTGTPSGAQSGFTRQIRCLAGQIPWPLPPLSRELSPSSASGAESGGRWEISSWLFL